MEGASGYSLPSIMKNGGKRNNLYFCVREPPMMYLAWKVLETLSRFCWQEKYASQIFLPLNLSFELWHLYKSLLPSAKGLSFLLYAIFIFESESPSSLIKAPTRRHYDRTWALGVVNMWVCFMNGSMIEHDGIGITFFSVDILKDMVACWYAWVLKSSCQN